MNLVRKHAAKLAVLGVVVASAGPAFAVDPATGLEALQTFTTGQAAYGPVMFALAVASVAIMIGVKWIKRGRGAA